MNPTKIILYKLQATLFTLLVFCSSINSQFSTSKLTAQFKRYSDKVLQEKLYMHVDRNFYLAGDIIWFKIYLVDASFHLPLDISKIAYVEVLDENNTAVLQSKITVDNGKGNGSFSIPISIPSANYKIRAYTNWMKNAGTDYFFEKQITIVNTKKNRSLTSTPASTKLTPYIQFFPEGGNLVYGITSKIACKVLGADGKGKAFRGVIIDEHNDSIVRFQSLQFGMGSFLFTPLQNHFYKAIVTVDSQIFSNALPDIYAQGYVMQLLTDKQKQLTVTVQSNITDTGNIFLLVHTRQSLKTVLQSVMEKGKATFVIDPVKVGEGISQFTIFNNTGKPVCERLYFTFPTNPLAIAVTGNLPIYPTRSRIDLAMEPVGQPKTDLSVSVFQLDGLQTLDEYEIQHFLWLSSDVKGFIESPGFYFGSNREETVPAIDNLMLTQGWRRFKWADILQESSPTISFAPELNGHIITGKVVSSITGKPVANIETYVSVPGLNSNFKTFISDSTGKLTFDFKTMKGSTEIIVQTNPTADTLTHVEINNPFAEQYSNIRIPSLYLSVANEDVLNDHSIGVQVQNLYAGTKLKRFVQLSDTLSLFENPDAVYMMDDYTRFSTIEEVLREYVTLMDVQKRKSGFSIQLLDNFFIPLPEMANRFFFQADPLILVDGVPVFNVNRLMGYDPLKMRKLEVYNRRYFLGSSFFSGILNWTSYKSDLANFELDPRALVIDYEGLQLQREFYSPSYAAGTVDMSAHLPDFRTLLYWSPEIIPDKNGTHSIKFYTSDKKGKYVAVIQGMAANGQCGSSLVKFEVR